MTGPQPPEFSDQPPAAAPDGYKTSEAANRLQISPNTLRAWGRRHGLQPVRTAGGHRRYNVAEIDQLVGLIDSGVVPSTAIGMLQNSAANSSDAGIGAMLDGFRIEDANEAVEDALSYRSLARVVSDLVLPAARTAQERHGEQSAHTDIAARWGIDWLRRMESQSVAPTRSESILIGDATATPANPDTLEVAALSLYCRWMGFRVVRMSVQSAGDLRTLAQAVEPQRIVLAGHEADPDVMARWAYSLRQASAVNAPDVFRGHPVEADEDSYEEVQASGLPDEPELAARAIRDLILSA